MSFAISTDDCFLNMLNEPKFSPPMGLTNVEECTASGINQAIDKPSANPWIGHPNILRKDSLIQKTP